MNNLNNGLLSNDVEWKFVQFQPFFMNDVNAFL